MSHAEQAIVFECGGQQLLGVLSAASALADVGIVIVVGGPQYRAGSHRQFVRLSRSFAVAGYPCLRFDCRGMGDSEGDLRSFEAISDDIAAAVGALMSAEPGLRRVVLWGLCDGASAALLYCHEKADPRVVGLALLNPWVRSESSLARTHVKHYYRQRLFERAFWQKMLSGKVAVAALSGFFRSVRASFRESSVEPDDALPYPERMARGWARFDGHKLLLLSEHDYTAREFIEFTSASVAWKRAFATRPARRVDLLGADHTCAQAASQIALEAATVRWLAADICGH